MLSQTFRFFLIRISVVAAVSCLSIVSSIQITKLAWAASRAEQSPIGSFNSAADKALSPQDAHICNLAEIVTAPDQIILVCQQAIGNIDFFTTLTTDDVRHANRVLATALTAQATARQVVLTYYPEADHTPAICDPARCRKLNYLSIK